LTKSLGFIWPKAFKNSSVRGTVEEFLVAAVWNQTKLSLPAGVLVIFFSTDLQALCVRVPFNKAWLLFKMSFRIANNKSARGG